MNETERDKKAIPLLYGPVVGNKMKIKKNDNNNNNERFGMHVLKMCQLSF